MGTSVLQWGGRFAAPPDGELLAFGSSLDEDLVLAPFDVACSLAHVEALRGGEIISDDDASTLRSALRAVEVEIFGGDFVAYARGLQAEDVHGAIDARVREIAGSVGEWLHAGRSRNDQVATTLLLYARDRARKAAARSRDIAAAFIGRAREELDAGTLIAGCTHRQPAQPVLLAFMLVAWSEPFLRATQRFMAIARNAASASPLGSAAFAGSTLPLDRERAAKTLGFTAPSRNALDAIANRESALDLAHGCVRAVIDASRIAEELIAWSTPAYGYVRLDDAVSTGSSSMPQKRNPDPLELVRAHAAKQLGSYAGALATLCGLAPSYQRDLQEAKAQVIAIVEDALLTLDAFTRTLPGLDFVRERMSAAALDGYTTATDIADALIAAGASARSAHALVGKAIARAEKERRELNDRDLAQLAAEIGVERIAAPLDALASVTAKRTRGSTAPSDVSDQIASLEAELAMAIERLS
jgi:argininosuccinate lyase